MIIGSKHIARFDEFEAIDLTITTDNGVVYEITESLEGIIIERKDRSGIGVRIYSSHKIEVV